MRDTNQRSFDHRHTACECTKRKVGFLGSREASASAQANVEISQLKQPLAMGRHTRPHSANEPQVGRHLHYDFVVATAMGHQPGTLVVRSWLDTAKEQTSMGDARENVGDGFDKIRSNTTIVVGEGHDISLALGNAKIAGTREPHRGLMKIAKTNDVTVLSHDALRTTRRALIHDENFVWFRRQPGHGLEQRLEILWAIPCTHDD